MADKDYNVVMWLDYLGRLSLTLDILEVLNDKQNHFTRYARHVKERPEFRRILARPLHHFD